ncbi:sulfatase/phosphatase domain-containing protein [Fontibacter flavus]|uniref:Sulfatase/phosphatase domain-containing protein n=1 Tax=Fontibacter flavus TaxID=654838 RepID=A0ABV6FMK9_9BACT
MLSVKCHFFLNESRSISRDALYWHYPHYGNQGGNPGSAIQEDGWKLIYFYEDQRIELYDLTNDLGERHDLAKKEVEKANYLQSKLMNWLETTNARKPGRRDID